MAAHSTPLVRFSRGSRASSTSTSRPTKQTPRRKAMRSARPTSLFEYPCPDCGRGTVRTTRIQNYKTKIKGFPFFVDEALVGVCDRCQVESFAPEETRRWEEAFYRSLEERQAFLSPVEIRALRTNLGLSMEDFARLIGCTRQSVMAWEKPDRPTPPSRMADLLLRLLQRAWTEGPVDVPTVLLAEAKKWGLVIELRHSLSDSP
jgi:putative zinc finger/helix-turn-helix YgiT family protein